RQPDWPVLVGQSGPAPSEGVRRCDRECIEYLRPQGRARPVRITRTPWHPRARGAVDCGVGGNGCRMGDGPGHHRGRRPQRDLTPPCNSATDTSPTAVAVSNLSDQDYTVKQQAPPAFCLPTTTLCAL